MGGTEVVVAGTVGRTLPARPFSSTTVDRFPAPALTDAAEVSLHRTMTLSRPTAVGHRGRLRSLGEHAALSRRRSPPLSLNKLGDRIHGFLQCEQSDPFFRLSPMVPKLHMFLRRSSLTVLVDKIAPLARLLGEHRELQGVNYQIVFFLPGTIRLYSVVNSLVPIRAPQKFVGSLVRYRHQLKQIPCNNALRQITNRPIGIVQSRNVIDQYPQCKVISRKQIVQSHGLAGNHPH